MIELIIFIIGIFIIITLIRIASVLRSVRSCQKKRGETKKQYVGTVKSEK